MSERPRMMTAERPRYGGDKTHRPNSAWDAGDGSVAILLGNSGLIAHVDAADYSLVEGIRWGARIQKGKPSYAYGFSRAQHKCIFMHSLLLACADGLQPDHEDGNGLNNRRINLRPANNQQNQANKRKRSGCVSRFKGVTKRLYGRWQARVKKDGKYVFVASFKDECDAATAYNFAALEAYGEFARMNHA